MSRSFKLVLLGNAGVGKSCLVLRFVREEFFEDQETTIGAAFLVKNLLLDEGQVKLEIWDTAGQERYRSLAPMYYRGAAAAIIVYDVTSTDSLSGAKSWVKELQKKGDPAIVIALVGNKADLTGKRKVDGEEAREYATSQGLLYMETSAKLGGSGVEDTFKAVAKAVLPKLRSNAPLEAKKDVVNLQQQQPQRGAPAGGAKTLCCG